MGNAELWRRKFEMAHSESSDHVKDQGRDPKMIMAHYLENGDTA